MKKYQTKFKLKVVKSFLYGEGGARLLARQWSVPEEKIRTWVSHYQVYGIDGLRPERSAYSAEFKLQVLSLRVIRPGFQGGPLAYVIPLFR